VADAILVWLTLQQAADAAQVGPKLLRREIKAGRLRAAKIGGRGDIRIHREWLDAWLVASSTPIELTARRAS
jgi:excisionase family DNA binding protein